MQLEFFDIPSPCVSVCQSDEKGLCLGCLRNRDERLNWTSFTSDDKQKVIKRCKQRKKRKDNAEQLTLAKSDQGGVVSTEYKKADLQNTSLQNVEQTAKELQPSLLDPPKKPKIDTTTDFDFDDFEL